MIVLNNKYECCGCTACKSICPKNAITMLKDEEGFKYPHINQDICVDCHLCEKICPYINRKHPDTDIEKCFASVNTNSDERKKSSSGGMFTAFANWIIKFGGVVFGAAFDEQWCVCHKSADSAETLSSLVGSKYMQSDLGDTYLCIKKLLDSGRKVLMVGTTCQINGLKNYLDNDYANLFCIDFICLGVPSPQIWNDYLNTYFNDYDIQNINFKDKSLGWHRFSLKIQGREKEFVRDGKQTYFFTGYFRHLYNRPSCSHCVYKTGNRCSDITISDFWGCEKYALELDDNKGLSAVVCHSEKGLELFEAIKEGLKVKEVYLNQILTANGGYIASSDISPNREKFWEDYKRLSKEDLFSKYCTPEPISKIRKFLGNINRKYKNTACYQNSRIDIRKFEIGIPYGIKGANLGSTYSKYAFGSLNENDKWWGDFSLSGQSLQIDYEILRSFSDRIEIGAPVFIGIGACVFLFKGAENELYYSILDKEHNPYYTQKGFQRSKYPIIDKPRTVARNILKSCRGQKRIESIYEIYGGGSLDEQASERSIETLVAAWKRIFSLPDLMHKDLPELTKGVYEDNILYLHKIIVHCIENGLKPIIFIPPFSDKLNRFFSEEYEESILINAITRACDGYIVPVYNYQHRNEFTKNYDLFLDGGFRLNKKGSLLFLSLLSSDLKRDKIIVDSFDKIGGEK
ncbi:MAG: Coenzyme F420 hydrogenase/dehydrogenase, beta subunit C-terminal domain [Lachnospiraceae bacterium]|nr:Coenzyme F420 hydrogenase/dehydrogenase, beta subunit C-terminal domain [Lachnospiraceae bacterium]